MESEKVKEIKKSLEYCCKLTDETLSEAERDNACFICPYPSIPLYKKALTLINELESENEQLKNRIAELEEYIKGNQADAKAFVENCHSDLKKELINFAERLKGKAIRRQEFIGELAIADIEYVNVKDIDETLKECLKV